MSSDELLLEAWRSGDQGAGQELLHRHFDAVHRFFGNKVDSSADAEDLIQQTFEACMNARDRFQGRSNFRTFVLAIAKNVLRGHYRRRVPDTALDLENVAASDLGGPSTLLVRRQEQKLLLRALRSIPLALQVVLELHFWEDMTGPEIGEVLGIPANTAYSRLRRAKEALYEKLSALADSPELLASTTGNLEKWAQGILAGTGS
jgi:RNA polymerase sigma factor (sigma-70 family)